jgi:hypothetical protein
MKQNDAKKLRDLFDDAVHTTKQSGFEGLAGWLDKQLDKGIKAPRSKRPRRGGELRGLEAAAVIAILIALGIAFASIAAGSAAASTAATTTSPRSSPRPASGGANDRGQTDRSRGLDASLALRVAREDAARSGSTPASEGRPLGPRARASRTCAGSAANFPSQWTLTCRRGASVGNALTDGWRVPPRLG